jgi:hypothetical protein
MGFAINRDGFFMKLSLMTPTLRFFLGWGAPNREASPAERILSPAGLFRLSPSLEPCREAGEGELTISTDSE